MNGVSVTEEFEAQCTAPMGTLSERLKVLFVLIRVDRRVLCSFDTIYWDHIDIYILPL